jgi:hypothetical protein
VIREGNAVIAPHEVQTEVDAGCCTGRREHPALVDEQHDLVDPHERMLRRERPRVVPVRGGPAAVEQAGRGERERAGGDRGEPGAALVGRAERVDHAARRILDIGVPIARDEDRLGPFERLEPIGHVVRKAVPARDETGRCAARSHLVGHAPPCGEHLGGDADVERLRPLEHEHGDAMVAASHPVRMPCCASFAPWLSRRHRRLTVHEPLEPSSPPQNR